MRVAHILPWPRVGGGVERTTLRLVNATEGPDIEHIPYLLPGADALRKEFETVYEPATYDGLFPGLRHPGPFLRASRRLAADFRARRIDLVHCSDVLAAYYAGLAAKLAHLPLLCHVRCVFDSLPWQERMLLKLVDRFVFVSQDTWRHFSSHVPASRGDVVYDGIDIPVTDPAANRASVFEEFGLPDHTRLVGMVARVAPAKDFETLIAAAAHVIEGCPSVRFLLVGDHSSAREYREYYQRLLHIIGEGHLEPYLLFTGHRKDVVRLIDSMDVALLVTRSEGLPVAVLEAMAQAKPVLATAVGGVPEIVLHGETGLLHSPGDATGLASQILGLLQNPGQAAALGQAGADRVRSHFQMSAFASTMREVYRKMIAS